MQTYIYLYNYDNGITFKISKVIVGPIKRFVLARKVTQRTLCSYEQYLRTLFMERHPGIHTFSLCISNNFLNQSSLYSQGIAHLSLYSQCFATELLFCLFFFFKFLYFTRHKISITNTCLHFTSGQPKLIIITINHCIAIDLI